MAGLQSLRIFLAGGAVAQWLECRTCDRGVLGWNPADNNSLRNLGNSVYPTLPVSFGEAVVSYINYIAYISGYSDAHACGWSFKLELRYNSWVFLNFRYRFDKSFSNTDVTMCNFK